MTPEQIARIERDAIRASFKGGSIPSDGHKGGRDFRIHTGGDTRTKKAVGILVAGAEDWIARGGSAPWTFTHAGAYIPRSTWGPISVLGSIDSLADLPAVLANGYAPARYVSEYPFGSKAWKEHGITWIPCPATTSQIKPGGRVSTSYASIRDSCPSTCKLKQSGDCYAKGGRVGMVNHRLEQGEGALFIPKSGNEKIAKCTRCRLCLNADRLRDRGMGIAFEPEGVSKTRMKRRLTVLGG